MVIERWHEYTGIRRSARVGDGDGANHKHASQMPFWVGYFRDHPLNPFRAFRMDNVVRLRNVLE